LGPAAVTPRDVAIIREGLPEMARSHWSIPSIVTSTTEFEISFGVIEPSKKEYLGNQVLLGIVTVIIAK
jgi:ethanolamine transporter EutH